jgi:hypothetical protein
MPASEQAHQILFVSQECTWRNERAMMLIRCGVCGENRWYPVRPGKDTKCANCLNVMVEAV